MKFRVIWREPEEDKGAVSLMPRSSIIEKGNIVVGQEVTCKWRKRRYRAVIDSIIDKKRAATSDVNGDTREVLFKGNTSGSRTNLEEQSPKRQSESLMLTEQMKKKFKETESMSREADRMAEEADRMANCANRLSKEADRVTEGLERLKNVDKKVDAMFNMLEELVNVIQRWDSRVPPTTLQSAATDMF